MEVALHNLSTLPGSAPPWVLAHITRGPSKAPGQCPSARGGGQCPHERKGGEEDLHDRGTPQPHGAAVAAPLTCYVMPPLSYGAPDHKQPNYRVFMCKKCGMMATVNPERNIYHLPWPHRAQLLRALARGC